MITQAMRIEALRELAAAEDAVAQARRHLHRAMAIHGMASDLRRDLERHALDAHRLRSSLAMVWQRDCADASFLSSVATAPTMPAPPRASVDDPPGAP